MINTKFLNIRDIAIILAVTLAVHMLAKPLYRVIDTAATSS